MHFLLSAESLKNKASIETTLQLIDREEELYVRGVAEARNVSVAPIAPRTVVFYGLGGSGIVGLIAATIYRDIAKTPLLAYNTALIPTWVGRDDFVVLLSYSGETSEVLRAARRVAAKGVYSVAICSGGSLERIARENGLPVVNVSRGLAPRMAVPEMLGAVTHLLDAAGILSGAEEMLLASTKSLEKVRQGFSAEADLPSNTAKKAALLLQDHLPHAISESSLYPVALRLKNQLNENAKKPCIVIEVPEAMHNTLEGLPHTKKDRYIMYRWSGEEELMRVQLEFLKKLLNGRVFEARFDGSLAEATLSAIMWSDYVSIYLAALQSIDPLPVSKIAALRRELEKLKK
ncbi:MAG: SIS domain-containing protein [Nitrososphaerota archaeon]|nr:SIS domain-containing protein [Candidatus Calditenuaceae archaeon]MDW8072711.1 SIS domain-containing protein [Nitrososphaerota archaeon]